MLDPELVDLADLALALEDHSQEHTWWFDPATGELAPRFAEAVEDPALDEDVCTELIPVEPLPTAVGYGDMEDFVAHVRDPRIRDQLERAIAGRGAFRRFKDALLQYPELRRAWFAYHDVRGERRAIEWLVERKLVDPDAADAAIERRPEPRLSDLPGVLDAEGVTLRVARDLRRLYQERLKAVMLIGHWARGDAHADSELELLVVLDSVPDRWAEKARMDNVMWRHSIRNDTVVTGTPVAEEDLERGDTPLLVRAVAEGIRVT